MNLLPPTERSLLKLGSPPFTTTMFVTSAPMLRMVTHSSAPGL